MFHIYSFLITLFSLSVLSGCAGNASHPDNSMPLEESPPFQNVISQCHLQPGDNLEITFYLHPELNENVIVRPDGRIALQLIDEIEVAGLTPLELQNILNEKYAPHIKNPLVTVSITSFGGQRVYVGGRVNTPGIITLVGRTTVVQAIFDAGGFRADASLKDVLILSRTANHTPAVRKINIKEALWGKLPEEETLLKPYDIVYVPKSSLVRAHEVINQVYKVIPPNVWFGFSYELHKEPYVTE